MALFVAFASLISASAQSNAVGSQKPKQSETINRKLEVKEISLGRIPDEMLLSNVSFKRNSTSYWKAVDRIGRAWLERVAVSPDQRRVAIVVKRDGKSLLVVDGKEGPAFDDIASSPWFSPNSERLACVVKRGDLQSIVVDAMEGKSYEPWSGMYPIFSPDSKRLAYVARRGSNTLVVVEAAESKPYRSLRSETPPAIVFSPDSKHYAYSAELTAGQWTVVMDGKEGKLYDSVSLPRYSPDSKRVLYVARQGNDQFVVVDGIEGPRFSDIPYGEGRFSPDGKRVAYQAQQSNRLWVLMVDGSASKEYDHIETSHSYFSPDSKRLSFAAKSKGKARVVIDGKESPEYDGIVEMPLFSPDSSRVAYAAARGGSAFMVLDGGKAKSMLTFIITYLVLTRSIWPMLLSATFQHSSFETARRERATYLGVLMGA